MKNRPIVVAVAALLSAGLLAGCTEVGPAPTLTPPPVPEFAPPGVTPERAQEILDAVEATIDAADSASDASVLEPRVTGPAAEIRRLEYQLQNATQGAVVPQDLWTDADIMVITATDSWPRSVLAVSNPTSDSAVRLYLAMAQTGPREPYRMIAWSLLLPGAETPSFADPEIGSAPVTAGEAALKATPADALARYADVLTNTESAYLPEFGADWYREFLASELGGLRTGVEVAGEVTTASTPGEIVFGIGTADGGAVVIGTMTTVLTLRKTVEGATLNLADAMAALGGTEEVEAAANATYQQMFTFYIPAAGSDEPIQLIGAQRVLASVERVD